MGAGGAVSNVGAALDALAPEAARRDEARRLLEFSLDNGIIAKLTAMMNPARPSVIAAGARRVVVLAGDMQGAVEDLRRDLTALRMVLFAWSHPLNSSGVEALEAVAALLPQAGEEAAALAEVLGALPSRGAPVIRGVRHIVVMSLLSVFERFHVSEYPPDHQQWAAERNAFLKAALGARSMRYNRRALEGHLRKIKSDRTSVTTGEVK